MKYKNTLQKGSVRYVVFREGKTWYAAGLEFNIVETGDTPQEALLLLIEAIQGYIESARKINAPSDILNQAPDLEYQKMWQGKKGGLQRQNVFAIGELNLSKVREMVPT